MTRKANLRRRDSLATTPGVGRLRRLAAQAMEPVPVVPPRIDPDLTKLSPLERTGETLRYSFLRLEHWLSPRGMLREYIRLNLRLALYLGLPAALLTPILTLLLTTAVTWSAILVEIARNLVLIPAWLGTGLFVLTGIAFLRRLIFGR